MSKTALILVAAGRGHRFGSELPKQYLPLAGAAVVRHAVEAFVSHPGIDLIQPVIHMDDAALLADALAGIDINPPVAGGETRQESVANGLRALDGQGVTRVLVHDAARPRVASALIDGVLAALDGGAAGAVPGLAVVDTLKRADATGLISGTVDRDGLWRAQTPQGFRFDALLAAHTASIGKALTDDAAVMEAAGHAVTVVPGDDENIKITTPDDLRRMEAIMGETAVPRIGKGFDVHKLGPGDGVQLCGIRITCELELIGHSDADVAMHALTDAILGAIAAGDIGSHFPPSEPEWKGAASEKFLSHAVSLARDAGYAIGNADITIICEQPKVGPHRDAMQAELARIIGCAPGRISVKATTSEGLGFTGRGEGIAAEAIVILMPAF